MQHLKAPIVGDPVYGLRGIVPHQAMSPSLREVLMSFGRQALHAIKLGLIHPATGEAMEWHIDLPEDMKLLLETMREDGAPPADEQEFDEAIYDDLDENEDDAEGEFGEVLTEDDDVE
jgi:23S rRNA pseudouridine1911/1915/1917 synthase